MAAAGYFVFIRAVAGGEYVTVPDITGKPVVEAYSVLYEKGLEVGKQTEILNKEVPKDYVIGQNPPAGKVVRAGRKVSPTISVGPDLEQAPNLIGQNFQDALNQLSQQGRFVLASQPASIPSDQPRGVIIGQDPPAGKRIPRGAELNVLVSGGAGAGSLMMRNLVGMPLEEAKTVLTRSGLVPVVIRVDRSDVPYDQILEQLTSPGSLVSQGDEIKLKVRTSANVPDAWREVIINYAVPQGLYDQEVRIDLINNEGVVWTLFPRSKHYVNGSPPRFNAGERITEDGQPLRFSFKNQTTVNIYLNGRQVRSMFYEGNADPVVTNFDQASGGNNGV